MAELEIKDLELMQRFQFSKPSFRRHLIDLIQSSEIQKIEFGEIITASGEFTLTIHGRLQTNYDKQAANI